jgi:serine phosphatase RsbU (regulator of sigma subunit)/pSer/pThr/pTyr-binding forkhead associated (FHA) protein
VARLKIANIDGRRREFLLEDDTVLIGRMPNCTINIGRESHDVSRRHAELTKVDGTWFLKDLNSRNHTSLNGQELIPGQAYPLRNGDQISICSYYLQFYLSDQDGTDDGSVSVLDTPAGDPKSSISLSHAGGPDDSAKLSVLLNVTQSLKNALSLDAVLDETLSALMRIFPSAQRAVIGFIQGDDFIPKWWKLRESLEDQEIKVSRTLIHQVRQRQEAILIENLKQDFPGTHSITGLPIESVMCAPLIDAEKKVFGAFQIDSASVNGFTRDDLVLMASVAIQASLAISYAKLHENALQQKAIEKDLELAREVQTEFLPRVPPSLPGYEFADYYEPARFIGGDYFDYVPLANGSLAVVLADVGGKGAPAALYMARMSMETRNCLSEFTDAATVISTLNRRLSSKFATFVMCVLDPNTHTLTIVNAGHRAPLRRKNDGTIEHLGESITMYPFGIEDDLEYESATFELLPGESVSILSDGFEDAHQAATDQYFGIDRIEASIQQAGKSAGEIVSQLVDDVKQFSGDTMQMDDMCVVAISRKA